MFFKSKTTFLSQVGIFLNKKLLLAIEFIHLISTNILHIFLHSMQRNLYELFNSAGHSGFSNDVSATLDDKTDPKDPGKREHYWIYTPKTKAPLGLNIEDGL